MNDIYQCDWARGHDRNMVWPLVLATKSWLLKVGCPTGSLAFSMLGASVHRHVVGPEVSWLAQCLGLWALQMQAYWKGWQWSVG